MSNFLNDFLKQLATGDTIRDYQHASKTFVDGGMALAPKSKFLYHVFFELNDVGSLTSAANKNKIIEAGMMVKDVELPKFSVDTKSMNAYNRHTVVQSKINYDPVTIMLHDDMSSVVREMWYDYYKHYYADSSYPEQTYAPGYSYQASVTKDWGYKSGLTAPYFKSIRIYQMHKKEFSEYVLVNPIITNWQHGQQTAGDSAPVDHTMVVKFDTVKYYRGYVSANTISGFSEFHYDGAASPLTPQGGGTQSLVGPGGLLDAATSITSDLAEGKLFGAGFQAFRAIENFKGADFKQIAVSEFKSGVKDAIQGNNPLQRFYFPNTTGNNNEGPIATQTPEE